MTTLSKEDHEKNSDDIFRNDSRDDALTRVRTAGTISMSPELFEKLYLGPKTTVSGELRKTFGNPTPLGLIGFLIGLTPLAACLMGWRGAGGLGAANIGVFFFFAGPLLMISGLLEFFLGNTFPFIVFLSYGAVFMALGGTLQPFYGSAAAYSPTGSFAEGLLEPAFNASLGFFPIAVAILNLVFMAASTRINAVFFLIFTSVGLGFFLLAATLWKAAELDAGASTSLMTGSGGAFFASTIFGWYLLIVQVFAVVGLPISLPVGDFSRFWDRKSKKNSDAQHSA